MKTTIKLLALAATIVGIGLVNVAAVSGGPAADSTGSSVTLPSVSRGAPSKAAEEPGPAVGEPAAAPAKEDKTGQLDYTPPNADMPEGRRADTGDVVCPGTDPCGP